MTIETLDALLKEELKDLYDAEKQLVRALPKMAKAASDPELKSAYQTHLEQTKGHVSRLEQVFELLEMKPKSKPCEAMKGLVKEGSETIEEDASDPILDVMLITASQKVEHYEISAYGTARAIAEQMHNEEIVELLRETLDEEKSTDDLLTEISERILGEVSASAGNEEEEDEDEGVEEEEEEEAPVAVKRATKKAAPRKR